jgi:hypothetical protein
MRRIPENPSYLDNYYDYSITWIINYKLITGMVILALVHYIIKKRIDIREAYRKFAWLGSLIFAYHFCSHCNFGMRIIKPALAASIDFARTDMLYINIDIS